MLSRWSRKWAVCPVTLTGNGLGPSRIRSTSAFVRSSSVPGGSDRDLPQPPAQRPRRLRGLARPGQLGQVGGEAPDPLGLRAGRQCEHRDLGQVDVEVAPQRVVNLARAQVLRGRLEVDAGELEP